MGVRDLLHNPEHFGLSPRESMCFVASFFADLDHCYLLNTLTPSLTDGQLQVMFASYLHRLQLSSFL